MAAALFAGAVWAVEPTDTAEPWIGDALGVGAAVALRELVERIETERPRYVFIGERHDVGPVKRFAVDLANELASRGSDVGLYVEGFRTDCDSGTERCADLARLFNEAAFRALRAAAAVPVFALDPPEPDRRVERMAATLERGEQAIRIVLVGNSHVLFAGNDGARVPIYGGAAWYDDPGDLVEAFDRPQALTIALEPRPRLDSEPVRDEVAHYTIVRGGAAADYRLVTPDRREY